MKIILIGGGKSKNSKLIAKNILNYTKKKPIYFIPDAMKPEHLDKETNYKLYKIIFDEIKFKSFNLIKNIDEFDYNLNYTLYIGGGNTFRLSEIFIKKNFKEKILKSNFVLIGSSAGAIWLGKSIKYAHDINENNFKDMGGANLVNDYIVFPHFDKKKHENEIIEIKQKNEKIILIPENGAILFENNEFKNIGEESCIIISSKTEEHILEPNQIIKLS